MRAPAAALLVLVATLIAIPAEAQDSFTVTRLDDPPPDVSCLDSGDCSLREAVVLANITTGPTTIMLPAGTLSLTLGAADNADANSGDLDLTDAITLVGQGPATVIDVVVANERAFDIVDAAFTATDLTIRGGGTVSQGGAIRTLGGPVTLERVALTGNLANSGGALFVDDAPTTTLTDVSVAGNSALDGAGGVHVRSLGGTTVTVTGGQFADNTTTGTGGGLFAQDSVDVTITGTAFRRNRGDYGGGLAVVSRSSLAMSDVEVLDNSATGDDGLGGGVAVYFSELAIDDTLIEGNDAFVGGGLHLDAVTATLTGVHVSANDADEGGGIYAVDDQDPLVLRRSLVDGNTAGIAGGLLAAAPTTLETTTVSGNRAGSTGGVSALAAFTATSSTLAGNISTATDAGNLRIAGAVTLTGSLLANPGGGQQPDDRNCVVAAPGTLTGFGTVVSDASCALPGGNLTSTDPMIAPLALNGGTLRSHALPPGSQAIDVAGATCPTPDARGVARPADGNQDGASACDAGAYEFVPGADLNLTLADSPDPVAVGGTLTYTATVFNAGPQTAAGARLVLTLAEGLADIVTVPDGGTCAVAGQVVTCELGALAAPGEARVRVSTTPTAQGQITTSGTATSSAPDPTPADAGAQAATTVGGAVEGPDVIAGDGVIPTAIAVSQRRFADPAQRPPAGVVLSRDDVFADSLGAAVLTSDAPLLFTATAALDPRSAAEIDRVLGGTGTVTLLGGESALSAAVADALTAAGYTVVRLQGPSRVETAIAVARAAAPQSPATVALARADGPPDNPTAAWADAVTGGAWSAASGAPVLLTATAALHPAVAAYLEETAPARRVLLGGEAALSPAVAGAAGPHERIQGSNRYATAAAIAAVLWVEPAGGYLVTAGDHPEGWAYALAAAGLAADVTQPVLLVETARLPDETAASTCAAGAETLTVIGGDTVVSPDVRAALSQPC